MNNDYEDCIHCETPTGERIIDCNYTPPLHYTRCVDCGQEWATLEQSKQNKKLAIANRHYLSDV